MSLESRRVLNVSVREHQKPCPKVQTTETHSSTPSALRARPRWRPPEAARDLRPHGDLRRRLVAGQRSAASQALSSPPPHPLSFLRRRLVGVSTWSSHCQDLPGSTASLLVNGSSEVLPCTRWRAHTARSQGVLTRRAHRRRTHNSTPRLRRRGHILSSPEAQARSGQIITLASVPRQEGRLGYRPRLNCEVRGHLLPLGLGPASSSS